MKKTHYSAGSQNGSSAWLGNNPRHKGLEKFCHWTLLRNGVDRRHIDSDQQIMQFSYHFVIFERQHQVHSRSSFAVDFVCELCDKHYNKIFD